MQTKEASIELEYVCDESESDKTNIMQLKEEIKTEVSSSSIPQKCTWYPQVIHKCTGV